MKSLLVIFFISIAFRGIAQKTSGDIPGKNRWSQTSVHGVYQNGYVFGTNNFLRGNNAAADRINSFQAFSLKLSKQGTGETLWQQLYNYPSWGIGIYMANFDSSREIGNPIALYGFFNAPFERWNSLSLNYELGLGAAFNWKSFNPVTNQYNIAIGGGSSFLVKAGLMMQYNFAPHIDLITGLSLTHFSNGSLKKPNKGINTLAPIMSIKYNFYDRLIFSRQEVPIYHKENEWLFSVFAGAKNVVIDSVNVDVREKYQGVYFPVFGFSTAFNRQVSHKSKIGLGMTVSYNGSRNAQVAIDDNELDPVNGPLSDNFQLSIYPSYELLINRFSIILQPAFYLYRKELQDQSFFYQRVGLKYHVTNNFFVGLSLRDYDFHVSDFIEWNMGYRIKWK